MSEEPGEESIYQYASRLLQQGLPGDALVAQKGRLARPIPVYSPQGEIQSWFVAVTVEESIVGFFQILPNVTLHRYSSFQKQSGSTAGCPTSDVWLSSQQIMARASNLLQPGETLESLYLTYDNNPDRLAWATQVHLPDGATQVIYVAGEYAYRKRE